MENHLQATHKIIDESQVMLSYRRCFPCVSLPLRDGHTTRTSCLQVSSQFAYCSSSMSGGTRLRPPTSVDGITRPSTASVVTEAKPGEQSPEIQTAGTFELNFRTAPSFLFPNYAIVQGYPSKAGDHAYGSHQDAAHQPAISPVKEMCTVEPHGAQRSLSSFEHVPTTNVAAPTAARAHERGAEAHKRKHVEAIVHAGWRVDEWFLLDEWSMVLDLLAPDELAFALTCRKFAASLARHRARASAVAQDSDSRGACGHLDFATAVGSRGGLPACICVRNGGCLRRA